MKNIKIIENFINKYNLKNLFSPEDLRLFKIKKYSNGENIIGAKDSVDSLAFIISGGVDIYSFLANGRSIFINKLSPPEIFGDVEFFGNVPMLFDVVANSDTVIMIIPFKTLEKKLNTNYKLWKFLGATSTKKLLKTNRAILLKEGFSLKSILALYLIKHNNLIKFNSLNELASELNVSYRNLTRVIKYFSDKQIIKKEKKSIITLDEDLLASYTEEI